MDPTELACNCGAVTMRLTAPPIQQPYCHCDDCLRATGSPYIMIALVRRRRGWREKPTRGYCDRCGATVAEPAASRCSARFPAGSWLASGRSGCHQACSSRHFTFTAATRADALPHSAGLPPEFGGNDERVAW